jgi:hypothetical protein
MKIISTLLLSTLFISYALAACSSNADCQHGTCAGGACSCTLGWAGTFCETALCVKWTTQCGAGVCYAPNTCNCTGTGFTGENCAIRRSFKNDQKN